MCQGIKAIGATFTLPVRFKNYVFAVVIVTMASSLWAGRIIDQNFGMCITPNDFIFPFYNTHSNNYYRPWQWCMQDTVKDFGSTIDNDRESFKVTLDVHHFRPNEISVKVANNHILVEGKHEERKDEHGFVTRQFTRRYAIPKNCMPEDVISNLSSDGVLTVIASKKSAIESNKNEKIVPITLYKSYSKKEQANVKQITDTNKEDRTDEINKIEAKKNTQIMLKEDHCCLLLKPELLRDAAADSLGIKIENTEKEEHAELKIGKQEQTSEKAVKNTSEMLQQTLGKSNVGGSTSAGKSKQTCDNASKAMSTSAEILEQICGKSSAALASSTEKGQSSMTNSQISALSGMSSKISESTEPSKSYKSCMVSNIKEISVDLSDFVCDISCSELDDTQDTKK